MIAAATVWATVGRILWALRGTLARAVRALRDGRLTPAERGDIVDQLGRDVARAVWREVSRG